MTNEQARHLYHNAGGQARHTDGEWVEIERDIRAIVDAPTIEEAVEHVERCMDWREGLSAMKIASTIRAEHQRISSGLEHSTDKPIPKSSILATVPEFEQPPIVELESEVGATYVRFSNNPVIRTVSIGKKQAAVTIDFDSSGSVVRIGLM